MSQPAQVQCIWPLGAELGEGVLCRPGDQAVWFVDIKAPAIHRFDPATGKQASWPTPGQVGFIVPVRSGGFVCGLQNGLYRFEPGSGAFERLAPVEADRPGNRINDGFVDPSGRLWFGTMDDNETDVCGTLYSWDGQGAPCARDTGYAITNGPALSPDGRTLYHTDSAARTVYAFDLDPDGAISGKRVFAEISDAHPDGMAVDAEGCVWVCLFGGWRIERFAPDGRVVGSVRFPCANITKLAFGGVDGRTAYVTTAKLHLPPDDRARQPLAGGLFAFAVDTPGLPQASLDL
jgi:sugar lactone lactonase YvrE